MSDSISLPRNSEAYQLVMDLRSNLTGNTNYTFDVSGLAAERAEKDNALDAIDRTFSNPQAAAYLAAHGKSADQMIRAVEGGNLAVALRGTPDPSSSALPSQAQRDAARQAMPAAASSAPTSQGVQAQKPVETARGLRQ